MLDENIFLITVTVYTEAQSTAQHMTFSCISACPTPLQNLLNFEPLTDCSKHIKICQQAQHFVKSKLTEGYQHFLF